jgi:iron complex outermembrane receptor protein
LVVLVLVSLLHSRSASGQAGAVSGTVRSAGHVVPRVRVSALTTDVVRAEVRADDEGSYRLRLPPGEYTILFRLPGYAPRRVERVAVGASGTTTVDAELTVQPFALDHVVVTAGRRSQSALDVESAVSVVDEQEVRERVTTSPLDHVLSTPGVDVAVQGLQGRQVVGRGFSGTFGPSLLLMSDFRNAALPSIRASLSYFLTPNADDIDRVEVVRGPASALYGPNAADGVVNVITRSPFDSPGSSVSLTGGGRSLFQGTGRFARVVTDRFAVKLSGTYFRGDEWPAPPQPSETLLRDPVTERFNGELRADLRVTPSATAILTLGSTSAIRNVEYTPVGAYQLRRSRADFAQLRFTDGAFFAQVYLNNANSKAGTTRNLQTQQTAIDHSNLVAVQAQHGRNIGQRATISYGVDLVRTDPQTAGTVNGRNEDDDTSIETGVFAQGTLRLSPVVQLMGAARADLHTRIDGVVFSPRAAMLWTPRPGQRVRVSYNRGFSTPTPGNLFLDVVAASLSPLPYTIRGVGVPKDGLRFARDCGGLCMWSPFAPGQKLPLDATLLWPAVVQILLQSGADLSQLPAPTSSDVPTVLRALDLSSGSFVAATATVHDVPRLRPTITSTFEVGYKGLAGDRMVFDVSVYATKRKDFIAPLSLVTPNVFLSTAGLAEYLGRFLPATEAAQLAAAIGGVDGNAQAPGIPLGTVGPTGPLGGSDILLTYRNAGDVSLWGADLSWEFAVNSRLTATGSYSWVSDNYFVSALGSGSDLSTNTPRNKAMLSVRYHQNAHDLSLEVRGRHVGGFHMVDGVWRGDVKAFSVADVESGIALPSLRDARLTLTVQNVADVRHAEFVAAPVLGRLLLARVQYRF